VTLPDPQVSDPRASAPSRLSSGRIESLQILRALAAMSVALHHSLADADALLTGVGWRAAYGFDQLAAGVDLFFVISGFVMVYASRALFATPGASANFLARRLTRTVPLYWIVTTVFLAVGSLAPGALNSVAPDLGLIAASYLFLPAMRPDGVVAPILSLGWTLNYEMLFYVVFAAAVVLPRRKAVSAVAAALGLLVVLGAVFAPYAVSAKFWTDPIILEFVFGMALAEAYLAGIHIVRAPALVLATVAIALLGLDLTHATGVFVSSRVIAWGIPAAMIVAAATLPQPGGGPAKRCGWLIALGDASYALYLTHPFPMRLLKLLWAKLALTSPLAVSAYVVAALATAACLAVVVHRFIEQPIISALRRRGRLSSGS
jgi:peptidoglycan/LPS O-acetylase OafA/YrhL